MIARKLRSKSGAYDLIIEINVPVRFYWANGEYDGLEFGPIPEGASKYQYRLMTEVLRRLFIERSQLHSPEEIIAGHLANRESAVKEAEKICKSL